MCLFPFVFRAIALVDRLGGCGRGALWGFSLLPPGLFALAHSRHSRSEGVQLPPGYFLS